MLVLSRRVDEKIIIGEHGEIVIQINEINGTMVRIGITAPKHIPVHREEIYRKINKNDK
jgi:carbon storage regulator